MGLVLLVWKLKRHQRFYKEFESLACSLEKFSNLEAKECYFFLLMAGIHFISNAALISRYFKRCWVYAVSLNLLRSCCSSTHIKIKQVAYSLTEMYHTLNMLSEIQILPSDRGFCNLLFPLIHYSNTIWWWRELGFINHQEPGSIHIQTRLLFPRIHLASVCEFFVCLTCQLPHFYFAFFKKGRRDRKIKPSQGKKKVTGKGCTPMYMCSSTNWIDAVIGCSLQSVLASIRLYRRLETIK